MLLIFLNFESTMMSRSVDQLVIFFSKCIFEIVGLISFHLPFRSFLIAANISKSCVADRELGGAIELCWNSLRN